LSYDRGAVFRNDGPTTSRSEGLVPIAFRQLVLLNAANGAVHFPRDLPIFPDCIGPAPFVAALLP
jgi:hypothetical protein